MKLFKWLAKAEQIEDLEPPEPTGLKGAVIAALRLVYDPEIPVNIYDLGLIYRLDVDEESGRVEIDMTLTAPSCPVAESLPQQVRELVEHVVGVNEVKLELVWEPPWSQERMSEAARLDLGML
jgi:FeS assembly SUF system protein